MRRLLLAVPVVLLLAAATIFIPGVKSRVKAVVRPEPPPRITPIAVAAPSIPTSTATLQPTATPTAASRPTQLSTKPLSTPRPEAPSPTTIPPTGTPEPTSGPVEVNGRLYDAYIAAATKAQQFFQYSCEFDAAWVILETYGIKTSGDELIARIDHDQRIEPRLEETANGVVIHGGDILSTYSGDYTKNYLARSTGSAMRKLFARYDLEAQPVHDRAGVEQALKQGQLVWLKVTVDFNKWRPATWIMPDGQTYRTVVGNDHAVVAIGYNADSVVIRDVLGPTSTNRQRPYEYEVDWATFLAVWEAQSFDGLAVARPGP